jgi:hypothetical protein
MSALHTTWLETMSLSTYCRTHVPTHHAFFHDVPANPDNLEPEQPDYHDPAPTSLQLQAAYHALISTRVNAAAEIKKDKIGIYAIIKTQIGRSMRDALSMDPAMRTSLHYSKVLDYLLAAISIACRTGLVFQENAVLTKTDRERSLPLQALLR